MYWTEHMVRIASALLCVLLGTSVVEAKPMNFVFFLVDDLGWTDVGCFGSQFYETPNIDALCASGMKFTKGYAACPVCSPTRASILTGRHPVRVNITDWIPGFDTNRLATAKFKHIHDRNNLALEEITMAEVLKEHGYQTFFAGKWHLGNKGHWPEDQGFDVNIGGHSKGSPPGGYYAPWTNPVLEANSEDEYLTERLTDESVSFLDRRDSESPFLLYLSYYNVHTPIQPYKKHIEHFVTKAEQLDAVVEPIDEHEGKSRSRQDNAALASMVSAVDDSVGLILKKLEELQLAENTVVIFFSDNGGLCTLRNRPGPTCNLPLRSGKGWLYEGGIREPTIIRSPGVTTAGTESDVPIVSMDFLPTMLELAGLASRPELHVDGISLLPLLKQNGGDFPTRDLFWHYPHYHGSTWTPGAAVLSGDWKLIEFYHYGGYELYNLREDPGEQRDMSNEHPAKAKEMLARLHRWQRQMNARMPEVAASPSDAESVEQTTSVQ